VTVELAVARGVVDVWARPGDDATDDDCLTQALLGEPAIVLEERAGWARVQLPDYEGWVAAAHLAPAPPADTAEVLAITALAAPLYAAPTGAAPLDEVYLGTVLPLLGGAGPRWQVALPGGRVAWVDRAAGTGAPQARPFPPRPAAEAVAVARRFLGCPYRWGGRTCRGIDCSGLVQLAYRVNGYPLPRDADQQWAALSTAVPQAAVAPGDLLFFARDGAIVHVALALGGDTFLHALGAPPRGVCVESLDPAAPSYNARLAALYLGARRVTQ
jgi:cell wall-associated NlpC family hydrolase